MAQRCKTVRVTREVREAHAQPGKEPKVLLSEEKWAAWCDDGCGFTFVTDSHQQASTESARENAWHAHHDEDDRLVSSVGKR